MIVAAVPVRVWWSNCEITVLEIELSHNRFRKYLNTDLIFFAWLSRKIVFLQRDHTNLKMQRLKVWKIWGSQFFLQTLNIYGGCSGAQGRSGIRLVTISHGPLQHNARANPVLMTSSGSSAFSVEYDLFRGINDWIIRVLFAFIFTLLK